MIQLAGLGGSPSAGHRAAVLRAKDPFDVRHQPS